MFDAPPREKEWVSWLWVGLTTLAIFASVPLARAVQTAIRERWGNETIGYGVIAVVVAASLGAVAVLRRSQRTSGRAALGLSNLIWLAGVAVAFITYTAHLWSNVEEAFHFVEYGALSLLLYRALTHRFRDAGIHLLAVLLGALVGLADEGIQWLVPERYWGLRDIWINLSACALAHAVCGARSIGWKIKDKNHSD